MAFPLRSTISTVAVLTVIVTVIAIAVGADPAIRRFAQVALLTYVALECRFLGRSAQSMLAVCLVGTGLAIAALPHSLEVIAKALSEASFIVGLFASVSLLRNAAQTSLLVQHCGELMVRQPPGRRFTVLCIGSHLIAIVLNLGVLPLLGTMIQKGNTLEAAAGDATVAAMRMRRMMTAVMQGYAIMTVWSPLSVSFTVTQGAVPGLAWWELLPLQIALSVIFLILSWLTDRLAFPPPQGMIGEKEAHDWSPLLRLSGLILAVVVASVAMAEILGVRLVVGAMIVVPVSAWIWLCFQQVGKPPAMALWDASVRLGRSLLTSVPGFRNEFLMLGGAIYLGTIAAAFISPELTAAVIARVPLPAPLLAIALVWGMMILARYGVSQIITVTLLGAALSNLAKQGIPPLVLASGLMGAWALSTCTTPVGAAILTMSRMANVSVATVATQWNGWFVRIGAVLVAVWMLALILLRS